MFWKQYIYIVFKSSEVFVYNSCVLTKKDLGDDGSVRVRAKSCLESEKAEKTRLEFAGACQKCFWVAQKQKLKSSLLDWCQRLDMVKLLHMALAGDYSAQAQFAQCMFERYASLDAGRQNLATIQYSELLILTRNGFQSIGLKYQNMALRSFLEKNMSFLSKGLYLVDANKVIDYVEAAASGRLSDLEEKVTSLVSKGALRADSVAKALVPALLTKADRYRRGKFQRAGTSEVDAAGVATLGFALGQTLKLPGVQRAFGLSRYLDIILCHFAGFIFKYFLYLFVICLIYLLILPKDLTIYEEILLIRRLTMPFHIFHNSFALKDREVGSLMFFI